MIDHFRLFTVAAVGIAENEGLFYVEAAFPASPRFDKHKVGGVSRLVLYHTKSLGLKTVLCKSAEYLRKSFGSVDKGKGSAPAAEVFCRFAKLVEGEAALITGYGAAVRRGIIAAVHGKIGRV